MKPVGDFLSEQFVRVLALPAPTSEQPLEPELTALAVLGDAVPPDAAKRLLTTLEQFVATSDFADAVNQEVPPPQPEESEDQFVQRAKEAIRNQLLKKFIH